MGRYGSHRLVERSMKPIELIAYGLMFVAGLLWVLLLYGGLGLSKAAAIVLSLILGPASVIIGSAVVMGLLDSRRDKSRRSDD